MLLLNRTGVLAKLLVAAAPLCAGKFLATGRRRPLEPAAEAPGSRLSIILG